MNGWRKLGIRCKRLAITVGVFAGVASGLAKADSTVQSASPAQSVPSATSEMSFEDLVFGVQAGARQLCADLVVPLAQSMIIGHFTPPPLPTGGGEVIPTIPDPTPTTTTVPTPPPPAPQGQGGDPGPEDVPPPTGGGEAPEPGTLAMASIGVGLSGLAAWRKRRKTGK